METLGTLTLGPHKMPVEHATFCRILDRGHGQSGWMFEVNTGAPLAEPEDETERFMFENGVRFYCECSPIPLEDVEDLTGVEVRIKEPFDSVSGEVYFTLYVVEHDDVSDVSLRFLKRDSDRYLMHLSALAHGVLDERTPLQLETWITRLPSHRSGE